MIRRPPRSTLDRSSAASDVYKRQGEALGGRLPGDEAGSDHDRRVGRVGAGGDRGDGAVSYTHLRAHETVLDLVCRLLLEKKKTHNKHTKIRMLTHSTTICHV